MSATVLSPSQVATWPKNPIGFCEQVFGSQFWAAQQTMIRNIWTHPRVAIKAGNGVGKSFALANVVLAFLYTHPQSMVITTSTTWKQVEKILWSEIRALWHKATVPLGTAPLMTELRLADRWFALGLSPEETESLQGYHAPHVLVIFDEASGIPPNRWEAAEALMVGAGAHWAVVGNPLEAAGPFFKCFQPGSGWVTQTISCWDSPNVVTGEERIPGLVGRAWVEQKAREWGEDDPLYQAHVLGQFPTLTLSRVIQPEWIRQCQGRQGWWPVRAIVSADVADMGDDDTVFYGWEGHRLTRQQTYGKVPAMETAGNLVTFADALNADTITLDATGLGAPVAQRVQELIGTRPIRVVGVNMAEKADRAEFRNRRAEVWWTAGEVLAASEAGLPYDQVLADDLASATYRIRNGKITLKDKELIKRELGRSPDRGDACVLGLWALKTLTAKPVADPWGEESTTQEAIRRAQESEGHTEDEGAYGEPR